MDAWTPAHESALHELAALNLSTEEIADALEVTAAEVARRLAPPAPVEEPKHRGPNKGFSVVDGYWTEERTATLERLWNEGHSSAQIARALGCTKNQVVGKAHRLHLSARPSPIKPIAPSEPRHIPADGPTGCRFPLWGNGKPTHEYCGAKQHAPGEPYCSEHRAICWVGKPKVRGIGERKSLEARLAALDHARRVRAGRARA